MHEAYLLATRQAAPVPQGPFNRDIEEILSLIGDGVVSIDDHGRIILFNRAAEALFGYTSAEILGCPIGILIPARFREAHQNDVDGFVTQVTPARRSMGDGREVLGCHKDGHEIAIEATLSRHQFAGQQTFTAVVRDVTDRQTAEQQRRLVAGEVAHRLRNTMAVVSSIVTLSARGATSLPAFISSLMGRFSAVSRTNDMLIGGTANDADLHELLLSELAAFQDDNARIELTGPAVKIKGKLALDLALIFHELATNAAKYGALSIGSGTIKINWHLSSDKIPLLEIIWQEFGGPKVVVPEKLGFGSQLIVQMLRQHRGQTRLDYSTDGVRCTIVMPFAE